MFDKTLIVHYMNPFACILGSTVKTRLSGYPLPGNLLFPHHLEEYIPVVALYSLLQL